MADPFSLIATGAGFTVKASQFISQLHAVDSETAIVVHQVQLVLSDIDEAQRLYSERKVFLSEAEEYRIMEVIRRNVWTINEIAKQVEPVRRDKRVSGSIKLIGRFDWVLRRSGTAKSYQDLLAASQRALHNQIFTLRALSPALNSLNLRSDLDKPGGLRNTNVRRDDHSNGDAGEKAIVRIDAAARQESPEGKRQNEFGPNRPSADILQQSMNGKRFQ